MAQRKRARPRTGLPADRRLLLSDSQWQRIAVAIDPDRSIADLKLPNGCSLQDGFRRATSFLFEQFPVLHDMPTVRKIRRDLRRFVQTIIEGHSTMCAEARALWGDPMDGWPKFFPEMTEAVKRMAASLKENEAEKDVTPISMFLADVSWLVGQCPGVVSTLPGKGYNERSDAERHALYRAARAAIRVASDLAEAHDLMAAPVLRELRKRKPSVLVERLRTARRRKSMLPYLLSTPSSI